MEKIESCDGIVLFANQCMAIVLKGSWDEEGFYPQRLVDVKFGKSMYGKNRLFPGDIIEVKVDVKKTEHKESIEWLEEMADYYEGIDKIVCDRNN